MINLIAAVGMKGEIGFEGRIPWLNDPNIANVVKDDLGWFARQTEGGVLVVGSATYREMLTMGFNPDTRVVWRWNGSEPARTFLEELERQMPNRDIWICGGALTFEVMMPFVQRVYLSRIPWTGPADRFMPPVFGGWGSGPRNLRSDDPFQRRVESYGDLDFPAPNHDDPSKRGFNPR